MIKNLKVFEVRACLIMTGIILFASSNAFPFPYNDLELKINMTTSETYNDNIDYNQENEKEDFVTRLRVTAAASYPGKLALLGFTGYMDQSLYAGHNERNAMSGGVVFNFEKDLSKYDRFDVRHEFTKTFEPGSVEDEFGRTVSRSERINNKFTANYSRDLSQNLTGSSQYSYSIDRIPDIDREDTIRNLFSLTSSYAYNAATSFFMSYEFSDARSEDGPKFEANSVLAGVRMNISKALSVNVSAGLDFIDSQIDDVHARGTDEYLKASVTGDFKTGDINLSLVKRKEANVYRQELFDKWEASLALTHDLTPKLNGALSGFWGKGTFQTTNVQENLLGADVTIRHEFSERLSGAFGYQYSRRATNDADQLQGYIKNSIYTKLDASF